MTSIWLSSTLGRILTGAGVLIVLLFGASIPSHAQFVKLADMGSTDPGSRPNGTPILVGTFLYGMTSEGGINNLGVVYKVKVDGTGYTKLLDFDGENNGSAPYGSFYYDGGTGFLYGMTQRGGTNDHGTIFKIKTDGSGFTKLFEFLYNVSGSFPYGSLISDGTFLYGMTGQGGSTALYGTVFKIMPDGSSYTRLLDFNYNTTGGFPQGSLLYEGATGFLYGMTGQGGTYFDGTVFKIKTDGTGFAKLRDFSGTADGIGPLGSLIQIGSTLYGMCQQGGGNSRGSIFKIDTDGNNFIRLYDFSNGTNGNSPRGALVYDGTFLYGSTTQGGTNSSGTVFKIHPDGTNFQKIQDLDMNTYGPQPEGTLLLDGTTLYGSRSGTFTQLGGIYKLNTNGTGYTRVLALQRSAYNPGGALLYYGTDLIGLSSRGGATDDGVLFKIQPDGTGYKELMDFNGPTTGIRPTGSLVSDGAFLYGLAENGGTNGDGTLFKVKPDGTGFTVLVNFDVNTTGSSPTGSLLFNTADGYLYGMTAHGGPAYYGNIFKVKTDGSGYTVIVNLDYATQGAYPFGSLITDGTMLYGMSYQGGATGFGAIFKLDFNGGGFVKLYDLDYPTGANPYGDLISDGTFLYGMTSNGGANGYGNVFKIKTDGSQFTSLLEFDGDNGSAPQGSLTAVGQYLYGVTANGGLSGSGSMFKIKPDGTGYAKIHDFNDGSSPQGTLVLAETFLYGTTFSGGKNNDGTIFGRSLAAFPDVTSFNPSAGVEGTYTTVYGIDFDPTPANNLVKFNGVTAQVLSGTADSLLVIVPVGATTGPVSVTVGASTGVSSPTFEVTSESEMFNGKVKTCDATFVAPNTYDETIQTFIPATPGAKLVATFNSFSVEDVLIVYDGPSITSPVLDTLYGHSIPADIIATGPGGELTFRYLWADAGVDFSAEIYCANNSSITITLQPTDATVCEGSTAKFTTAATGTTNITYQWQAYDDLSLSYVNISDGGGYSGTTTPTLSVNTTGNFEATRYACLISGDLAGDEETIDVGLFINPTPTAPSVTVPASACGPVSFDLTATGGTNGQYRWYTAATGGTAISGATNGVFTTPALSTSTTYYVSVNNGTCESARIPIAVSVMTCHAPAIAATVSTAFVASVVTIDLTPVISDIDNNVDITSLKIIAQPQSGAPATINGTTLRIDYSGFSFLGSDRITLSVCDLTDLCATQDIVVVLAGDVTVYNAISPNGDGKNDVFIIQYIDIIPEKKDNMVRIYNRWGEEVFSVSNYNNHDRVFAGLSNSGSTLPSGTYFYKITFASGGMVNGYLELKY